jgi:hypothetical protein
VRPDFRERETIDYMFALIGYGLLGIVVAVGVVSLLVLVLPADHLAPAPRDVVPSGLPTRPEIRGEDVARVRLPVTLRGYRMVDTDAILDRLAFELERRDQEIDNLRERAGLPPREPVEDSAFVSMSEPLEDRARDEVLLPVGASASGGTGAHRSSVGDESSVPPASRSRRENAPDLASSSGRTTGVRTNSAGDSTEFGVGPRDAAGGSTDAATR